MMKPIVFLLFCCLFSCTASAQIAPNLSQKDREAISSLLQQTMKHTDEKRLLDFLLGKWKLAEIADPLGKPSEMDGQAESNRISMDLFVEEQLQFGGPQFAILWRGVYGFDPLRKKFTATWFTNLNTIAFQGVADVLPNQNIFSFRLSHPFLTKIEEATQLRTSFVYRITIVDPQQLKFQLIEVVEGPNALTETVQWQVVATKPIE